MSLLLVLLLVGCSEKHVSSEVQARRELREVAKESREADKKASEESKVIKELEDKVMHNKYNKIIINNDVIKITLTTKMTSHNAMQCVIKNKTNKDIVLLCQHILNLIN